MTRPTQARIEAIRSAANARDGIPSVQSAYKELLAEIDALREENQHRASVPYDEGLAVRLENYSSEMSRVRSENVVLYGRIGKLRVALRCCMDYLGAHEVAEKALAEDSAKEKE